MRLIEYMKLRELSDDAMAALVGGITAHGIRKIKYGERSASLEIALRIEAVTEGAVPPREVFVDRSPPPAPALAEVST